MKPLRVTGRQFNRHAGVGFVSREDFIDRVREELDEAANATTREHLEEELADVILTIASMADCYGLDVDAAVTAKHAVNLRREWESHPTIPGCVKHKRVLSTAEIEAEAHGLERLDIKALKAAWQSTK